MKGLIAKKIGMTRIFTPQGVQISCTIVEAQPCSISQIKTKEKDGYDAYQLAAEDKKLKHSNKGEIKHFAKSDSAPKRFVKEFRDFTIDKKLGDLVTCDIFSEGEKIDVIGFSKGKGFQGVVKRHGFTGVGESTHGQHDRNRAPGSIGASSFPSRVFKGTRMAGRTGGARVKVKGLQIVKIFPDKNCLLLKGAIPGSNNATIYMQSSK